jgi:Fic-DOC domain mobile mystery protein B
MVNSKSWWQTSLKSLREISGFEMDLAHATGATPLDADEAQGLIPTHIDTMGQLNEWEQSNILHAEGWLFARKRSDILTEAFVRRLHREMFSETWQWAGKYRTTQKNLGVPAHSIVVSVINTCDRARYWVEQNAYPLSESAVRLHHRMVAIHPFPNGNGRHTRMLADAFLHVHDAPRLTWGRSSLHHDGETRAAYLHALREADMGRFASLIAFASN